MNSQLERIGDIAVNIAERAEPLLGHLEFLRESRLSEMAEIARIMTKAHERVLQMLTSRRELLEVVAQRLLEREVIEGEELRGLVVQGQKDRTAAAVS